MVGFPPGDQIQVACFNDAARSSASSPPSRPIQRAVQSFGVQQAHRPPRGLAPGGGLAVLVPDPHLPPAGVRATRSGLPAVRRRGATGPTRPCRCPRGPPRPRAATLPRGRRGPDRRSASGPAPRAGRPASVQLSRGARASMPSGLTRYSQRRSSGRSVAAASSRPGSAANPPRSGTASGRSSGRGRGRESVGCSWDRSSSWVPGGVGSERVARTDVRVGTCGSRPAVLVGRRPPASRRACRGSCRSPRPPWTRRGSTARPRSGRACARLEPFHSPRIRPQTVPKIMMLAMWRVQLENSNRPISVFPIP